MIRLFLSLALPVFWLHVLNGGFKKNIISFENNLNRCGAYAMYWSRQTGRRRSRVRRRRVRGPFVRAKAHVPLPRPGSRRNRRLWTPCTCRIRRRHRRRNVWRPSCHRCLGRNDTDAANTRTAPVRRRPSSNAERLSTNTWLSARKTTNELLLKHVWPLVLSLLSLLLFQPFQPARPASDCDYCVYCTMYCYHGPFCYHKPFCHHRTPGRYRGGTRTLWTLVVNATHTHHRSVRVTQSVINTFWISPSATCKRKYSCYRVVTKM